jgi:tetratricopeptide (TPR) repeat protein
MSTKPTNNFARDERLQLVVLGYLKAVDAGQAPDQHELLAHHPDLGNDLRAFFSGQQKIRAGVAPLRGILDSNCPRPFSRRIFGDYELVKELGHGGMGIVYKARQISLKRTVALKMILAGQLASPDDRRRFRAEAENAATLDHPNIVPIYEVGEIDGHHYFTMKRIDGGSLAQHLQLFTHSPRASARLVAKVARAVHHAHRRGILHRDLKPANVLVDRQRQPHITDFGLAKRVEGNAVMTQTGIIVGTPSYMAPEQAGGRRQLTTAVDVHGLGTVLYELLTGRPAFWADTVVGTLRKVLDDEPVRPRTLNSRLDRDLETICLKCLEKDPGKRYGSAEALAEDLEYWLAGEPIEGRRSSAWERTVKWAKRKPALAALVAVSSVALVAGIGLMSALWVYAEKRAAAVDKSTAVAKDLETSQNKLHESQEQVKGLKKTVDQSAAKSGRLYARSAEMYMSKGKYDQAMADCTEALKLRGDHLHHAYFTRGCVYKIKGEYEKAITDLSEAIRIGPNYTQPYEHRGIIYVNLREWNKAAEDYGKLLNLEPTNSRLWLETAYLRLQVGDNDGYQKLCRRMLDQFGQSPKENDIVFLAATCVLAPRALGDGTQVRDIAEKRSALPSYGHHVWSVHVLGHAYYRTGMYDRAVECLERGLKDHPNWEYNVFNWLVLAMAHQRLKHETEARKWLVKAQERIQKETLRVTGGETKFAPKGWLWRDVMGVEMLRREAETLIKE